MECLHRFCVLQCPVVANGFLPGGWLSARLGGVTYDAEVADRRDCKVTKTVIGCNGTLREFVCLYVCVIVFALSFLQI